MTLFTKTLRIAIAALLAFAAGCASVSRGDGQSDARSGVQTPAEIMPITAANLRGQREIYREGWFIVSSTDKALDYAKERSIVSSAEAMRQARAEIAKASGEYAQGLGAATEDAAESGRTIYSEGSAVSAQIVSATTGLIRDEVDWGNQAMRDAWSRFYRGNITLAERTQEDRQALAALPGGWYRDLKEDFSNLSELTDQADAALSSRVTARWGAAFEEAKADWQQSYERSGRSGNSFAALGELIAGYGRALYAGLVSPAAQSAVQGGEKIAKGATKMIFLPVATVFILTGRTVAATGMSIYYTASGGVKLVSPTIEGGLLAGLSLLSYAAVPVTGAAGYSAGAVNQVAIAGAAPVAGTGQLAAQSVGETVYYAAQVSYDVGRGITHVALNQVQSGIVLGYNALTALPTQTFLAASHGVIFLAWDGPRLVIASAKGEVQWQGEPGTNGKPASVSLQKLPVGSVVDLQALRREAGVKVEVLSDDPAVIERVLEKIPQDARGDKTVPGVR